MLSRSQEYVLHLIRKSMGINDGLRCELSAEETEKVLNIIVKNGILQTVYNSLPDDMKGILKTKYSAAVRQSILHQYEGETILNEFSKAGIDCLPLKGWELRKLYPEITMRQMADLDYYVKPYDYSRLSIIMKRLGFEGREKFSKKHDVFFKDCVTVEMHKRLTDFSGNILQWEKGMWDRTVCTSEHIHRMSDEDYYIFHFIHLYKDLIKGSLGLRRIIDTWLLRKTKIDKPYVRRELDALGLLTFHNRIIRLCRVCMGEVPPDRNSEILLNFAFSFGILGSDRSIKAGRITSASKKSLNNGKFKVILHAVFPSYGRMSRLFPRLQKQPVLLPIYWIIRIVKLLRRDHRYHLQMLDLSKISEKDIRKMKAVFKAGGLID